MTPRQDFAGPRADIYFTNSLTINAERVLTTRPVRHPPIIVASDGQVHNEMESCFGGLLAEPVYSARFAVFSVLPKKAHRLARSWSTVLHCPNSTGRRTQAGRLGKRGQHRDVIWFVGSCAARSNVQVHGHRGSKHANLARANRGGLNTSSLECWHFPRNRMELRKCRMGFRFRNWCPTWIKPQDCSASGYRSVSSGVGPRLKRRTPTPGTAVDSSSKTGGSSYANCTAGVPPRHWG